MSNLQASVQLFLQLAFILLVCRVVGLLAKRLGQPQVVAEMIAGVLMGPSLFGLVAGDLHTRIFPASSLQIVYVLSQIGLVLYMFLIGLEFDPDLIRSRMRSAFTVSGAGILLPFALGAGVAPSLLTDHRFFNKDVAGWEAMIYMGASMSITAFPMLARIIYERGLTGTSLGTLALAAASLDDASAWCLLAIVLASFQSNARIAVMAIGGGRACGVTWLAARTHVLRYFARFANRKKKTLGGMILSRLSL